MPEQADQLTPKDIAVIGEVLHLAADGPLFPDWEFQTLFGIERNEMREVAKRWPKVDFTAETVRAAVLVSLVWTEVYPHGCHELVEKTLGVDMSFVHQLYRRAAIAMGEVDPPDDFVARLTGGF
jgi:hypothetical protein